jgi:NADH:ubiquinone reductase (H+-translocating)
MEDQKDSSPKILRENFKNINEDSKKDAVPPSCPCVVILGVGFGGLFAAQALAHRPVDVKVIDRNNYHTFFPLLYQVAAAELEPEDIAYPARHIFRNMANINFFLGNVEQIDFTNRQVKTSHHSIHYDYLILALGSRPFYYGIPGADEYAFPLKSVDQAITLRNQILNNFELASCETDPKARESWLTFTIVGGGPTGVEFAGAMAELIHSTFQRDYHNLNISHTKVLVIEAGEHLLTGFPTKLGNYAKARLEKMGVEVRVNAQVVEIGPDSIRLKDQSVLSSKTVIWTAGVQGFWGAGQWGLPTLRNGQVDVLPTLQVPEHPEVYIAGDLAHVGQNEHQLPMVAQVAIQQGKTAAHNILRQIQGQSPEPFHYHDRGILAVIGRNSAAAQIAGHMFTGFLAWVIWLSIHIFYLIGFRNRLLVLINWAWDYFSYERNVDLIVPSRFETITKNKPVSNAGHANPEKEMEKTNQE